MFNSRLKQCREERKLSQTYMANILNITRQAYNHYETGNRLPTQETLIQLANFFEVSVDYLLGRTEEPTINPLDKELEGVDFMLWGEVKELTDDQKKDILDYVRFKKKQRGE